MTSSTIYPVVWLIDDDETLARDVITYWERLAPQTFQFRYFPHALGAWDQFKSGEGTQHLYAIVVDGHLRQDEGDLAWGAEFVRRVRTARGRTQPNIIGFSGDPFALEDMEQAGADAGFYKGEVTGVLEFLRSNCLPSITP